MGRQGRFDAGQRFWFEYHCFESLESGDAAAWLRSHEQVTVLKVVAPGYGKSPEIRATAGEPCVYRARWDDGFEWDVFEDELVDSPGDFCRPDPPKVLVEVQL
jgi:hypothetical protein